MPPQDGNPSTAIQPYGMGVQAVRAVPPRPDLSKRDLTREYVASGNLWWYRDAARRLPWAIDDVSADFGPDIYEQMLHDPQVNACGQILKLGILEDGIHLAPAVDDTKDINYDDAKAVYEHLQDQLDSQEYPLDDALYDMLDATFFGNRIAEVKWEFGPTLKGRRGIGLNPVALKVKPLFAASFVVDAFQNVVGLLAQYPGQSSPGNQVIQPTDPNLLPRSKFAILSFRPRNGDPRGTSVLRAAYDPWWRKRQILIEYMRYITQFAGPSVIGYTPPADAAGPQSDPLGNLILDPNTGQYVPALTPEEQMLTTLLTWRNGLAAAFPYGSKVDVRQPQGNGEAFLKGIALSNIEITKAILTQQLATEQGEHMARAAAQVHQDVLATIIRQAKKAVVRMVVYDLLRRWVALNLGDNALHLTPRASLGQVAEEDKASTMNAVANLERAGYLHPSQYAELDAMLGLPARDLSMEFDQLVPVQIAKPQTFTPSQGAGPIPDAPAVPPDGAGGGSTPPSTPPPPTPPSPTSPARLVKVRAHSRAVANRLLGGRPPASGDGAAA